MKRPLLTIFGLASIVIVAWMVWSVVNRMYFAPAQALHARIEKASSTVSDLEATLAQRNKTDQAVRNVVDRTLGANLETVDHRFRTRLNRIAEEVGIHEARIATGLSSTRGSPAKDARKASSRQRELWKEPDFVELEGSVAGVGTLEQVINLIERIDDEPWIKRIESLRIDPSDNGNRIRVSIGLRTLFVPGREPTVPPLNGGDGSLVNAHSLLVQSNPFRVPPPIEVAAAPPPAPPQPPAPPKFPYEAWALTGIADGPTGHEVWLLNAATKEARSMALGESLGEAKLVAIHGLEAEFEQNGARFRIEVGKSMHDRRAPGH